MNKSFFKFFFFCLVLAFSNNFGATITRYVNTASAGGDGTTNGTSGANAAYASLSTWEAAEQTDLVLAGDIHEVICEGTVVDNVQCNISGWTTGPSNYIVVKTDPNAAAGRHAGKWDGKKLPK